ncbi:hypothetical protein GCM10009597_48850 [Peribacillus frigoritolerans]
MPVDVKKRISVSDVPSMDARNMQMGVNRPFLLNARKESDRKPCERFMYQEENKCDQGDETEGKRKKPLMLLLF